MVTDIFGLVDGLECVLDCILGVEVLGWVTLLFGVVFGLTLGADEVRGDDGVDILGVVFEREGVLIRGAELEWDILLDLDIDGAELLAPL